jgi:hypothetical protein
MLDDFAIAASPLLLVLGGALLYVGDAAPYQSQNMSLLGGATLLTFGLFVMGMALKNKWAARQNYKR